MLPRKKDPFHLFLSVLDDLIFTNSVSLCITNYITSPSHCCQTPNKSTKVENVQEVWLCWVWIRCQHQPLYQSLPYFLTHVNRAFPTICHAFLELSLHPPYSSSSHLPHCISPATLVLEAVDSMMKCTYWETLAPIFTSLYLSCLECQFY